MLHEQISSLFELCQVEFSLWVSFSLPILKHIIHPESGLNLPFFALSWPMSLHPVLESAFDISYFLFIAQSFLSTW